MEPLRTEAGGPGTRNPWRPYPLPGTGEPGTITLLHALGGTGTDRRSLLVALPPPRTGPGPGRRDHPVLYLHDGQNLFDPATSHAGDWDLVETLNRLAREGSLAPIVVGITHRGSRRTSDYNPFRGGDRYLDFLLGTVKPLIERSFPVSQGPGRTAIAGSSLGGLISLYARWRHPGVFGAAGALSPSLWVGGRRIFRLIDAGFPNPLGRLYLDVGTGEGAEAVRDARALRDRLIRAGTIPDRDLRYVEDPGARHHEAAWGRRLREALPFLLGEW